MRASSLLMLGSVPLWVAAQMGHTDTAMITRTDGKWIRSGLNQDKRRRLELIYCLTDPAQ
jgi:integrase